MLFDIGIELAAEILNFPPELYGNIASEPEGR